MKKINIKFWFISLILVSFLSCSDSETEKLFPDAPADRVAQRNAELLDLLLSEPNGYKGVYFTKNDEFGGFTYYLRFNADGTVDMTSDFDVETAVESSSYEVRIGTSTELVFTTRNHIQKVSDPSYAPLVGTGFKGTSVFQYFTNDNGTITFRDIRSRDSGTLVLTPANFSNFETESIASVEISLANRNAFVNSNAVTAFPFLSVETGGNLTEFALNYDSVRLFANPTKFNEDGSISDEEFGIAFTENGLIVSPALNVDGVLLEEFTFDGTSGFEYVATKDGITAKIGYGNAPVTPLDAYAFGVRATAGVFNMDERFKSSTAFNNFYDAFAEFLLNTYGVEVSNVVFWDLNNGGVPYIELITNAGRFWYDLDFEVTNGIVVFTPTGNTNASAGVTAIFQPLLDAFIGAPSGYYLLNTGNYLNFSNRTYSMINVDDPTMTINYWDFSY